MSAATIRIAEWLISEQIPVSGRVGTKPGIAAQKPDSVRTWAEWDDRSNLGSRDRLGLAWKRQHPPPPPPPHRGGGHALPDRFTDVATGLRPRTAQCGQDSHAYCST